MRNLIIVGNGFDLAHGLKTSFAHFGKYLKSNPQEYGVNLITLHNNQLFEVLSKGKLTLWNEVEYIYFDILTHINDGAYLQNYYSIYNGYSVEKLNENFAELKKYLQSYLSIVVQDNFKPVENYKNFFNAFRGEKAVVLNFNYTNTVKEYTDVTDIDLIHIHGELYSAENPIIFGFAPLEEDSKTLLVENDNNYVRNIKKFNYLFTKNEQLLKKHLESNEYRIIILGHSCGISDRLILKDIFNSKNVVKIIPFYYENREGYFNTMVNIDRIIDDYSKPEDAKKAFDKLMTFPNCYKMPQKPNDAKLSQYLNNILNDKLPNQKKADDMSNFVNRLGK